MNREWLIDLIRTEVGLAEGQGTPQFWGPQYEDLCRDRGVTEDEVWWWDRVVEYELGEEFVTDRADSRTLAFLRDEAAVCEFLKPLVSKWRRGRPGPVARLPWEV